MSIRFRQPAYDGDRRVLMCGNFDAGAVFPPLGRETKWRWSIWFGQTTTRTGNATTEGAAKNAALAELRDFLRRAGLREVE